MARKPLPAATPVAVELNQAALNQAGAAATELVLHEDQQQARVRAVAERVGYQLLADVVDPDLLQRDIAANMRRSVEACLEVGRGLCVLKEICPHGAFLARLEVLGMDASIAVRFMQAAAKFSNAATSQLLKAAGNQSKLFELLVLDDEQVEELALLGQTGELELDDVATMGVRELRAALRQAKEDKAAKDRVISDLSDKNNGLRERLEKPFKPKKNDPAKTAEDAAALAELVEATNGADVQFARLATVVAELQDHRSDAMRERALQSVQYMVARLREVVLAHGLEVQVDDETLAARPAWLGSAN